MTGIFLTIARLAARDDDRIFIPLAAGVVLALVFLSAGQVR